MFEARLPVAPEYVSSITNETRRLIREYFEQSGLTELQIQDIEEVIGKPRDPGLTMIRQEYGNLWLRREHWT
jgi:hypothetical protein